MSEVKRDPDAARTRVRAALLRGGSLEKAAVLLGSTPKTLRRLLRDRPAWGEGVDPRIAAEGRPAPASIDLTPASAAEVTAALETPPAPTPALVAFLAGNAPAAPADPSWVSLKRDLEKDFGRLPATTRPAFTGSLDPTPSVYLYADVPMPERAPAMRYEPPPPVVTLDESPVLLAGPFLRDAEGDVLTTWCLVDSAFVKKSPADVSRAEAWMFVVGHQIDPRFPWTRPFAPPHDVFTYAKDHPEDIARVKTLAPMNLGDALPYDCAFCGMALSREAALRAPGGSCGCVKGTPFVAGKATDLEAPTYTARISVTAFDAIPDKHKRSLREPLPGQRVTWTVTEEPGGFSPGRMEAKLTDAQHAALVKLVNRVKKGLIRIVFAPILRTKGPAPAVVEEPPPPLSDAALALQRAMRQDKRWMREIPDPGADEHAAPHKGSQCVVWKVVDKGWAVYVRGAGESELTFREIARREMPTKDGVVRVREYSRKGNCIWDSADESSYQDTAKAPAVVEAPQAKAVGKVVTDLWRKRAETEPDRLALRAPATTVAAFCTLGEKGWRLEVRGKTETFAAFQARYESAILDPHIVRVRRYDKRARCVADSFDVFPPSEAAKPLCERDASIAVGTLVQEEKGAVSEPAPFVLPEVPAEPLPMPTTRVWIREAEWDALDPATRADLETVDDVPVPWDGRAGFVTAVVPFGRVFFALVARCEIEDVTLHQGDTPPPTENPPVSDAPGGGLAVGATVILRHASGLEYAYTLQELSADGQRAVLTGGVAPIPLDTTAIVWEAGAWRSSVPAPEEAPGAHYRFTMTRESWAAHRADVLDAKDKALYREWKAFGKLRTVTLLDGPVARELLSYFGTYGTGHYEKVAPGDVFVPAPGRLPKVGDTVYLKDKTGADHAFTVLTLPEGEMHYTLSRGYAPPLSDLQMHLAWDERADATGKGCCRSSARNLLDEATPVEDEDDLQAIAATFPGLGDKPLPIHESTFVVPTIARTAWDTLTGAQATELMFPRFPGAARLGGGEAQWNLNGSGDAYYALPILYGSPFRQHYADLAAKFGFPITFTQTAPPADEQKPLTHVIAEAMAKIDKRTRGAPRTDFEARLDELDARAEAAQHERVRVLVVRDDAPWIELTRGLKGWNPEKTPSAGGVSGGTCRPLMQYYAPVGHGDIGKLLARLTKDHEPFLDLGEMTAGEAHRREPSTVNVRSIWNGTYPDQAILPENPDRGPGWAKPKTGHKPNGDPKPPKKAPVVHRLEKHDADKRVGSRGVFVAIKHTRRGWDKLFRGARATAPEWRESVTAFAKGANVCRVYNRAGACTWDSRDGEVFA